MQECCGWEQHAPGARTTIGIVLFASGVGLEEPTQTRSYLDLQYGMLCRGAGTGRWEQRGERVPPRPEETPPV